jgi:hypothetical protein
LLEAEAARARSQANENADPHRVAEPAAELQAARVDLAVREIILAFASRHPGLTRDTVSAMVAWGSVVQISPTGDPGRYLDALLILAQSGEMP